MPEVQRVAVGADGDEGHSRQHARTAGDDDAGEQGEDEGEVKAAVAEVVAAVERAAAG